MEYLWPCVVPVSSQNNYTGYLINPTFYKHPLFSKKLCLWEEQNPFKFPKRIYFLNGIKIL